MQKIILWVFIFFLILSLLSIFTPLTFNYFWLTYTVYVITVLLSFFVASTITNKSLRAAIKTLPALFFISIFLLSFLSNPLGNTYTSGWKTAWIGYRNIKDPNIYIAQQMMDIGARGYARRTVKVMPVFPFVSWITVVSDSSVPGTDWKKVDEDLNPFNLKGG